MARSEDFGVQRFVGDRPQIFEQQGWMARLNVPLRDCGTGMTDDEVTDLSARVDLAPSGLLDGRRRGRCRRPRSIPRSWTRSLIYLCIPCHRRRRPVQTTQSRPATQGTNYQGRTRVVLRQLAAHNYEHVAEALVVPDYRGCVGTEVWSAVPGEQAVTGTHTGRAQRPRVWGSSLGHGAVRRSAPHWEHHQACQR
jgi:hypothetical protein